MFRKVLVANRGEIACRVIRACRELGIRSVAIYSRADADSLHVRLADEALCVGEANNPDSYLHLSNVLMAAEISGADAVHPGYGYFSENAAFADVLGGTLGVKFIGPPVAAIEAMGDKASAKRAAIESDCPVVPGSDGPVDSVRDAQAIGAEVGYPVLLKAVAGGGGRGIRRVDTPEQLEQQWGTAQSEALASFGSGELIVEKCLLRPRHVEVQVFGDEHGQVLYLGERECSIQNLRHQKIIEEAPCATLSEDLRRRMGEAAVRVAKAVGYANAGTVEFLLAGEEYFFLEMNTRLQVEHPVTEEVTGLDLVRLQIAVALGEKLPLSQNDVKLSGHAIEVRVTAQDPEAQFAPSTGRIGEWIAPCGLGVRMETHCYAGFTVSPCYDPLLAKLVVRGANRDEAVNRLRSALREFHVAGIHTSLPFLRQIADHPDFRAGVVDTGFVPRLLEETHPIGV